MKSAIRVAPLTQGVALLILSLSIVLFVSQNTARLVRAQSSTSTPTFSHTVLVLEENHSYNSVINGSAMPYLNSLARRYGLATNFYANTHPSIGNYFMLATGQIITNNDGFTGTVNADNIVRQLISSGKTWKSYAESLPGVGYTGGDQFPYIKHHNPFAYFSDVVNSPVQANNLVPFSQFSTDLANNQLPNYSFVVPNRLNDAHDCPAGQSTCTDADKLAAADNWLQTNIAPLLANPTFQQDGLLIITFDESADTDTANGGGQIATVVISSNVKSGYQSTRFYQHQSALRLTCDAAGISACPGAASTTSDMSEFFIPAVPESETVLLSDDFNAGSVDTTKWSTSGLFSGTTDLTVPMTIVNQRIEIGPLFQNTGGSHYNGLVSNKRYDFTGASASVQPSQVVTGSTAADVMFTLGSDVNNFYRLYYESGNLIVQKKVAGAKVTLLTTTYNPTNHAFWRIRHDPDSNLVVFETATNNAGSPGSWSQIFSEIWNTARIPLTSVLFEIKAGTWQTETSAPGTAAFDSFKAARQSTAPPQPGPAPTVTNISPNTGPADGGTSITITGTGFATGAAISIGNTPAINTVVISATTITVTTPPHSAGTVNLSVTNQDAQSGTLVNGFTYTTSQPAETVLLADDFSNAAVDGSKWIAGNLFSGFTDSSIPVAQTTQRLQIGPLSQAAGGSHYNGIRSATQYNFTGAYAYVQVSQVASGATAADVMFTLGNDVNSYYRIYVESGNLIMQKRINGTKTTMLLVPYNPANHSFWRVRHDRTANAVVFEAASNNSGAPGNWTSLYSEAWSNVINVAALQFELKAGTWQSEATNPGAGVFDNFRVARP